MEMLFCQDFRGCHHGTLVAVFHRDIAESSSDHRLTGANVALDKAVHEHAALHVVKRRLYGSLLGAGGRKRQEPIKLLAEILPDPDVRCLPVALPDTEQSEFQLKQFLKNKSVSCPEHGLMVRRKMDFPQCLLQRHKRIPLQNAVRQRVHFHADKFGQSPLHRGLNHL